MRETDRERERERERGRGGEEENGERERDREGRKNRKRERVKERDDEKKRKKKERKRERERERERRREENDKSQRLQRWRKREDQKSLAELTDIIWKPPWLANVIITIGQRHDIEGGERLGARLCRQTASEPSHSPRTHMVEFRTHWKKKRKEKTLISKKSSQTSGSASPLLQLQKISNPILFRVFGA